ncbi:MAG: hypothetical protein BGO49_01415 [Planctomycetales bacterium 71-10]|nr:MAG: hypothetical protein BGO49_01415 [Planctomycetales bacterium 71-10]
MAIPGAAYGQQSDRTAGGGFGRARRFFDPSTWTKPRAATAGEGRVVRAQDAPAARDPRLQLARQEPDLAVPAADRALGGGDPVIGDVPQPTPPDPSAPVGDPSGAGTSPGTPDLAVPAADRAIGGGEPTDETAQTEEAEAEADDANAPKHLQDLLGFEESPVKIYGWIQNSYTGNTNGRGKSGENFGVNPNHKANWWMGNQYYIVVENPLELDDTINFGFRVDNLFGNDWQFNYMQGLFNNAFPLNYFPGYDLAQLYGEVHLPFLTEGGIDVKGGRFYTIAGYEQVPAIARPLLSTPYMFTYGQPFTHTGVLTTWHLTDKVNLYNGAINGWDRWINERYTWGYIGGFSWTSEDDRTTLAMTAVWGPNQFPSFLPNGQQIYPGGYVQVADLAGLRNPGYWRNDRTLFTWVGTHKWNDKLTQVVETDQGWERSIPGLGSGGQNGAPRDATWFSFGNWFLYEFNPKLTGVWRSEVFWDPQGARTQKMVNGQFVGDRFYEMTVGAIYKPHPNLWIRPEARYDWSQYHAAYTDDTRKSQFTLAVDAIILW